MTFEIVLLIFAGCTALASYILSKKKNIPAGEYWEEVVPMLWIMTGMFIFFALVSWIFS